MEKAENKKFDSSADKNEEEDEETKFENRSVVRKSRQLELMKRGEKKDFIERLLTERNEAEEEETLLRAQEARFLRCLQTKQTQNLGEELRRRKNDEIRESKLRQLLRNDSIELRRLEAQLREAYSAKSAETQLLERKICRKNSKIREIEDDRTIEGWYQDDRFEKQKLLESQRKKDQYRRDLQNQLFSNYCRRQREIEETRNERKLIVDTLTLGNGDHEDLREKREKAKHLLVEQKAFLEAQRHRKLEEKEAISREQKQLETNFIDETIVKKPSDDVKKAAKETMIERMTQKFLNDQKMKREREDAINELMAEEQRNELENRAKNATLEKRRIARELLNDMERQKIVNEATKAREAKIDREFAAYLDKEREKCAIADKRKQEDRRAKGIQYGKDLKEAIERSHVRYVEDILENQAALKRDRMIEDERRKSIKKERERMLGEHETHLIDFFKPDV